jgi:hypothetical protein
MSIHEDSKGTADREKALERSALIGEINKNLKYKTIELFAGERNKL